MRTRIWLSAAALVIGAFTASVLAGAGGGAPLVDAVKAKEHLTPVKTNLSPVEVISVYKAKTK